MLFVSKYEVFSPGQNFLSRPKLYFVWADIQGIYYQNQFGSALLKDIGPINIIMAVILSLQCDIISPLA